MEDFIEWCYSSPTFTLLLVSLCLFALFIIFDLGADIEERFRLRKENNLLKRDLSYCKQFMCEEDYERYKLHRQFDIELEKFLKEQSIIINEKWNK